MKIGIVTLYDEAMRDVAERTLHNKAAYARRHGYGLVVECGSLDPSRPTPWSKILALKKHLTRFDWVFWSDIDAMLTNLDTPLEKFLFEGRGLVMGTDQGAEAGFPGTAPGDPRLNTSQFLLRNCAWSRRFLDDVYRQEEFLDHPWWEQQAVMHVLEHHPEHLRRTEVLPPRRLMSNVETFQSGDFAIHFGGREKATRMDQFLVENPKYAALPSDDGSFRSELDDSWYLLRYIGRGVRQIGFRADGAIGNGGSRDVQTWRMRLKGGRRVLEIRSDQAVTAELTDQGDGQWRGAWRGEGGGEILVTRHRAQVLVDLLRLRDRPLIGAEVGVFTGESSAIVLESLPRATLLLIDAWRPSWAGDTRQLTDDPYLTLTREEWDLRRRIALESTQFAEDRRVVIETDLLRAATFVPEGMDFVFLDADHSYECTLRAIEAYWPKLSYGDGLMCGHDYGFDQFPGVAQAVDDFAKERGLTVRTESDFVWWYER